VRSSSCARLHGRRQEGEGSPLAMAAGSEPSAASASKDSLLEVARFCCLAVAVAQNDSWGGAGEDAGSRGLRERDRMVTAVPGPEGRPRILARRLTDDSEMPAGQGFFQVGVMCSPDPSQAGVRHVGRPAEPAQGDI